MGRPCEVKLGNGEMQSVMVTVKEGMKEYKPPKSVLKKKRMKIEKKPPPPKSVVIPSLMKPLAPVLIVKEMNTPANIIYHNSKHGLVKHQKKTGQVPLKRSQYRLGKKARPYSSSLNRAKGLTLFDK